MSDGAELPGITEGLATTEELKRPEKPNITQIEEQIINGEKVEAFTWPVVLAGLITAKAEGKTIIATNGHFVLFHEGHSDSLLQGRELAAESRSDHDDGGVVALVIVNNDAQTFNKSAEKGALETSQVRAANVLNDKNSDFVVISEASTENGVVDKSVVTDFQKLEAAGLIDPNFIYVKGSDYAVSADDPTSTNVPPEAQIVLRNNGKFKIVQRRIDISSTQKLEQLKASRA